MLIFGVTGGSGSGKTTVSKLLSEYGVHIIDTDMIAREVTGKGSQCLKELVGYFGSEIVRPDGTLDRRLLASRAFSDDKKRAELNRITHKYIKKRVIEDIKASGASLTAIDGAVIIGSSIEPLCAFIVSVTADRELRLERIMERDALSGEQAAMRIDAQPDNEFYEKNSKYVIHNNGDAEELKRQIREFYDGIKRYNIE